MDRKIFDQIWILVNDVRHNSDNQKSHTAGDRVAEWLRTSPHYDAALKELAAIMNADEECMFDHDHEAEPEMCVTHN